MKARLILDDRRDYPGGLIQTLVIWILPEPVPGSNHNFKYRLFFGRPGERLIGYDNERGKGDHRHVEGREEPYVFSGARQLLDDFDADVARWRAARQGTDDTD